MTVSVTREELMNLARIQCTIAEMCLYFRCHRDVLARRTMEYFDMGLKEFVDAYAQDGKVSLKRKGFQMALKGDKEMLKLHLKNYCEFTDKVDNTHSGLNGGAIKTESTVLTGELTPEQLKAEAERRGLPTTIFDK